MEHLDFKVVSYGIGLTRLIETEMLSAVFCFFLFIILFCFLFLSYIYSDPIILHADILVAPVALL